MTDTEQRIERRHAPWLLSHPIFYLLSAWYNPVMNLRLSRHT
jgi:hypothetical protein